MSPIVVPEWATTSTSYSTTTSGDGDGDSGFDASGFFSIVTGVVGLTMDALLFVHVVKNYKHVYPS